MSPARVQQRLAYCRRACSPLLAIDEVDHLLALPTVQHVPVVRSGDFAQACAWVPPETQAQGSAVFAGRGESINGGRAVANATLVQPCVFSGHDAVYCDADQRQRVLLLDAAARTVEPEAFNVLRSLEVVVVVCAGVHYVVVHIWRERLGIRARLYDSLNSRGFLTSRTHAGFLAAQDVRRVFAFANPGLQINTFDDGACAAQSDSITCGLHAAYNAALLAGRHSPSNSRWCAVDAAANIMVDLAHAALRHREAACGCSACVARRAVRGYARLVEALSLAFARPSELRGALRVRCMRLSEVWEDGEVLPLELPVPKPNTTLKAERRRVVQAWGRAHRAHRTQRTAPDPGVVSAAPAPGAAPAQMTGDVREAPRVVVGMELDDACGAAPDRSDGSGSDRSDDGASSECGSSDADGDEVAGVGVDAGDGGAMSRSLLRNRYFVLLEEATVASVEADRRLAAEEAA